MRQAQLKAEQDSKKQEEEGEPLITVYIPVNYSTAKTEILPHLSTILTKDRGKISVDERNNQIIFTDIAEKVKQAKEIVAKIDTVTAQVSIEARVVEANSSFSREIGFDWGTITIDAFKIGGAAKLGPTTYQANNIPTTFRPDNTAGVQFLHAVRNQHCDCGREAVGERTGRQDDHHILAEGRHPEPQEGHHQAGPRGPLSGTRLLPGNATAIAIQESRPAAGGDAECVGGSAGSS